MVGRADDVVWVAIIRPGFIHVQPVLALIPGILTGPPRCPVREPWQAAQAPCIYAIHRDLKGLSQFTLGENHVFHRWSDTNTKKQRFSDASAFMCARLPSIAYAQEEPKKCFQILTLLF